jgi:hypothetical protein
MLLPLIIAPVLLLCSLLTYGTAMHLVVHMAVKQNRTPQSVFGFWRSIAVMAVVTLIMAAAHLTQIALWALALLLFTPIPTFETALYLSAQNYTALGYGDIQMPIQLRLLGPLESINGLLFFGLSTSVMFAALSQLIANRIRTLTVPPLDAQPAEPPLAAAAHLSVN